MIEARQHFVTVLEASARDRIVNAVPWETLSNRNGKIVELVGDINGTKFVRRSYSHKAVEEIEDVGLRFTEAWGIFQRTFTDAGITVVPTLVISQPFDQDYPIVMATEYMEGMDVRVASVEIKIEAATKLAATLKDVGRFFPHLEAFQPNMFTVRVDESGAEELVLIDVDPYLMDLDYLGGQKSGMDTLRSMHIGRFTDIVSNVWCKSGQRQEVMSGFVRSLGFMTSDLNSGESPKTLRAIMDAHSKAQGIDFSAIH